MIHKKLQVVLLVLLSGCTPGIETVYKNVQAPGSGYIYFYNVLSVQDEIAILRNALDSIDRKSNPTLYNLIGIQMQTSAEVQTCLKDYMNDTSAIFQGYLKTHMAGDSAKFQSFLNGYVPSVERMAVVIQCIKPRPPFPCPPTDSLYLYPLKDLVYCTRNPEDSIKLYRNGQLHAVLTKGTYHNLTKIRIIRVPRNIHLNNGDTIELKIPVRFLDSTKKQQDIIMEYKEIYRK
jgi:hypothetical protein